MVGYVNRLAVWMVHQVAIDRLRLVLLLLLLHLLQLLGARVDRRTVFQGAVLTVRVRADAAAQLQIGDHQLAGGRQGVRIDGELVQALHDLLQVTSLLGD